MQSHRPLRGIPTFGAAAAGVLVGHQLTYLLAHPVSGERHAALMQTGHAYLPFAGKAVLALALAAVVTLVLRAVSAGPWGLRGAGDDLPRLAARLWAIQAFVFASMEIAERLAARAPLGDLAGAGLLPIGMLALAGTALLGACLLRWLHRAVAVAIAAMRTPVLRRAALVARRGASVLVAPRALLAGAAGVRGPPPRAR